MYLEGELKKSKNKMRIGLALSGGGSRAIAFHLGCMKALHDEGVLDQIELLSSVSGGSVIAAMYAYSDVTFDVFSAQVKDQLRRGFIWGILRYTLCSTETVKILGTILTAGIFALIGRILIIVCGILVLFGFDKVSLKNFTSQFQAPLRRAASRTTAFERYLRNLYGDVEVTDVKRKNLNVVINSTELRTGAAFRFGSRATGCWRFGSIDNNSVLVSKAVAASAAFPALLPSLDLLEDFSKDGVTSTHRVILTDGGVYDNLGISCMIPSMQPNNEVNAYKMDFIICCSAGAGQSTGHLVPYSLGERMVSAVETIHSRTHTLSYDALFRLKEIGLENSANGIKGFILPYLGQQDHKVGGKSSDFVTRAQTFSYPTDFNAMTDENIDLLTRRGELLTKRLLSRYVTMTSVSRSK